MADLRPLVPRIRASRRRRLAYALPAIAVIAVGFGYLYGNYPGATSGPGAGAPWWIQLDPWVGGLLLGCILVWSMLRPIPVNLSSDERGLLVEFDTGRTRRLGWKKAAEWFRLVDVRPSPPSLDVRWAVSPLSLRTQRPGLYSLALTPEAFDFVLARLPEAGVPVYRTEIRGRSRFEYPPGAVLYTVFRGG